MEIGPVLTDILDATTDLTNRSSQPLAVASKFAYGQFNLQFCSGGRSRQRWLSSVSLDAKVRLAIAHPFSRSVGRADAKRGERASSNKAKRSVPSRQLECQAMDCDCRAASQAP